MTNMPEEIWAWMGMQENGSWDPEPYENISTPYLLKSTVDAEIADLKGNINILELRIKAQDYWTDALKDRDKTIRELAFALEIIVEQSHDTLAVGTAQKALSNNVQQIAEANHIADAGKLVEAQEGEG